MATEEQVREYLSHAPEEVTGHEYLALLPKITHADFLNLGNVETPAGLKRKELHRGKTEEGRCIHAYLYAEP